jgi:vacuolar protein sorting-associated protein 33A
LTYEGLIDEFFEINDGCFQPNFDCVPGAKKDTRPKVVLNSSDSLFVEIRDLNQMYVGQQIKKKSTQIESEISEKNELQTVQQIKEYTKKLPRLQEEKKNWEMHLKIAQEINDQMSKMDFKLFVEAQQAMITNETYSVDFIEELINKQEPLTKVLRLICLASVTGNGIKAKTYDFLRKEIVQVSSHFF